MARAGDADEERHDPDLVRRVAGEALQRAGVPAEDAALVGDALLDADLSGIRSHGLRLLPGYLEQVRTGAVRAAPQVRAVHGDGAVRVVDGDNGLGQVVAHRALAVGREVAAAHGMSAVAVRRSNHLGALGYFTRSAAEAGFVAFLCQSISTNMAAAGGTRAALGNNPFSFALPAAGDPVVLDMSCSEVAGSTVVMAAERGEAIPATWAIDEHGNPTTDPQAALRGALLPLAGHKGAGLAVVMGALAALLSGAGLGAAIPKPRDRSRARDLGHLLLLIDVGRFGDPDGYAERLERYGREIVASGPDVRLPGHGGAARRREARTRGVALPAGLLEALRRGAP